MRFFHLPRQAFMEAKPATALISAVDVKAHWAQQDFAAEVARTRGTYVSFSCRFEED
jgi:hypothetical protein